MRLLRSLVALVVLVVASCNSAGVPVAPSGWSRVPHDEMVFGGANFQGAMSVTAWSQGLVAVGASGSVEDDLFDAAVWISGDGVSWSRVPHDELAFGGEGFQSMSSVTAGGPGLVAVGVEVRFDDDAAVWTSNDGMRWSRVRDDVQALGGEGFQFMSSVTVGGPGLVAVGADGPGDDQDAAVWISREGIIWERVRHDEAVFGGDGFQIMSSVTVGGPGLVAVGFEVETDADAAVWTSLDGITWTRVDHDETIFSDSHMTSVTAGGPGVVAVGWDTSDDRDAVVWTSPDGIVWSRVPHDVAIFGGVGNQEMESVAVVGTGLVAVGSDDSVGLRSSGNDLDAAVWVSPDGITWSRFGHDDRSFGGEDHQEMESVTAGGPGLVAVGRHGRADDFDAAMWVATTEAP